MQWARGLLMLCQAELREPILNFVQYGIIEGNATDSVITKRSQQLRLLEELLLSCSSMFLNMVTTLTDLLEVFFFIIIIIIIIEM